MIVPHWRSHSSGPLTASSGPLAALVGAAILATTACATPHTNFDYGSEPDPRKQEYTLGPSDVLKISVWRNADISGETIVRPDGTISLPLIGDVRAAGRTPGQVRDEINRRLATFIKDETALVTVSVAAVHAYRFVVSGNVERAGVFESTHYVTVAEAITLAGGPNKFASPEQTIIIRSDPTHGLRRIPVDYPSIASGSHLEQDLPLLPGDRVYVP